MGYRETVIVVADDCPVTSSVVPAPRGGKPTVAQLQHELLVDSPYTYTQEEVLFEVSVRHKAVPADELVASRQALWDQFFSKDQACLRASPLPKKYGYGFHFDAAGRVALLPMKSQEYRSWSAADTGVTVLKAMRSSRR